MQIRLLAYTPLPHYTLFAWGCMRRYCRLCKLEVQVIDDEMTEGQKNVFHAMQREGEEEEEFEEESKPGTFKP